MRHNRIKLIKERCVDFLKGDIQKQYKRNGDLVFKENFTKRSTAADQYNDFEDDHGTWDYNANTGILDYLTINGTGLDTGLLDLYTLIRIDTDSDGYLYAVVPYNVEEEITFEIDNRGIFIINEN